MTIFEKLQELGAEDAIVFKNPDYESAIIGVTHNHRIVYDYNKMVTHLIEKEGLTDEQAREWIDYNTIRALPYSPDGPIVLFTLEED